VCGPKDLMDEVRYLRKRLGGGMRQVGVIAAAARIALRDRERLVEDPHPARYLAERLAERWPGTADPATAEPNRARGAAAGPAGARIALRDRERLVEDHPLARYLAERLAERWPGTADPETVETNMVRVDVAALPGDIGAIRQRLAEDGILTGAPAAGWWRLVTHRDVDRADVDRLVAGIAAD